MRPLLIVYLIFNCVFIQAQKSTFDFDNEGWMCDGDPTSTIAFWEPSGGNPGGYIDMTDASTGGTWYFVAPPKFLGPKCDAYGKFIRYDQFTDDTSNPNTKPDVELKGAGLTLVFDHPVQPNTTWTHYDLFLREDAGWRINDPATGLVPTKEEFKAVLADITSFRIRGEYHHFALDHGALDNVILESNFSFDLDEDNSSGPVNGDFRADTSCFAFTPVLGDDPVLTSEGPIDSIRITLQNPNGMETLSLNGTIAATLQKITISETEILLVNLGNATTTDFLAAIVQLQYVDNTLHPLQGTRRVLFVVFAGCGEAGRQVAHLPIFTPPQAGLPGDTTVCTNTTPFNMFNVLKGSPDPGGQWEPALSIGPSFFDPAVDTAGTYAYIFHPTSECQGDTSYVTVRLEVPPVLRPDTTLCYDEALRIERPRGALEWTWSTGGHQAAIEVIEPGVYGLVGETEYCSFEDSVVVGFFNCKECELYVPNVFTPDDDGDNDYWQAFLPCRWLRFRMEVYDRWGSLVFATDNPDATWDGRIKGKDAQNGVYVWRLEWDAEVYQEVKTWYAEGDVTVVR